MPSTPAEAPDSPAPTELSSPLVIASIAIVCTIFLVCSFYRVIKPLYRAFIAATYSTNLGRRRLVDDSNFEIPSQNQSNALESSLRHSLPMSRYKKENKEEPRRSNTDCAVCLGEFEEGDLLRELPNCTHAFHISCIDTWFQSHSSCPLCRSSVSETPIRPECSVSMFRIMETLNREDFSQDRAAHYQMLRSEVLRNSALIYEPTGGR